MPFCKHVIVEGPDGSGKDTLIADLMAHDRFTMHPRASTSLGGPVDDLAQWVDASYAGIRGSVYPSLFNRHPVISEPIYGRFRPNKPTHPMFCNVAWLFRQQRRLASLPVLVVWCMPGVDTVRTNVLSAPHDHMPGVASNIDKIYRAYQQYYERWPGPMLIHNYTRGATARGNLIAAINRMVFDV